MYVPAAQQGTGPQDAQWDLSAQCHQVATTQFIFQSEMLYNNCIVSCMVIFNQSQKQVRQQDAYLATRPAYPRGCCPRAAKRIRKLHMLLVSLYFQRSLRYRGCKGQKWSKIRIFGPPCRNPLVSALHIRLHFTTLRRNRNDSWLKYHRRNQENRFCVTHFWPILQNHVTDGSKHMRQLDRGEIKLFSLRCLYASIFNSF